MSYASEEALPAIVCLHGHGSNGSIFELQSHKLMQVLGTHFRFLFLDSPITTAKPGVGVLPYYADVTPYRRWQQDEKIVGLFDVTIEDVERERALIRQNLVEIMEAERKNGGPGVVGVMGFSQGARVATAICQDPELGQHIKLAIMVCGISPSLPLTSGPLRKTLDIPSIHIQGSNDPWKAKGTRLAKECFDQQQARVVGFTGGHEIPNKLPEVVKIADEVIAAYGATTLPEPAIQPSPLPISV